MFNLAKRQKKRIKERNFFSLISNILKILMIILLPLAILITVYLHHQDYTILRDILKISVFNKSGIHIKSGYDQFLDFYKMPLGLSAIWLAVTTLFLTLTRIIQTTKQLKLMDLQQKQSILPDLHLLLQDYFTETEEPVYGQLKIQTYELAHGRKPNYKMKIYSKDCIIDKESDLIFEIVNIGRQSAKIILATFHYDLSDMKYNIDKLGKNSNDNFIFEISKNEVKIKSNSYENKYNIDDEFKTQYFDFLLPATEKEKIQIIFPKSYFELFVFYLELSDITNFTDMSFLTKFPILELLIKYEDILSIQHEKKYLLKPYPKRVFNKHFIDTRSVNTINEYKFLLMETNEGNNKIILP